MSKGFSVFVDEQQIGRELRMDADLAAAAINELAYAGGGEPGSRWLGEFLEGLDDDGRALIRTIAAALDKAATGEGGGS